MKICFSICLFIITALCVSQEKSQKYWIYFSSKDQPGFSKISSQKEIARMTGISVRAQVRRKKVMQQTITSEDLPVSQTFLSVLREKGIAVENTSRWFNAATAYLTPAQSENVRSLPFVRSVAPVAFFQRKDLPEIERAMQKSSAAMSDPDSELYGKSLAHMKFINAVAVHKIGIKGNGVLVGMLDTGFRWKIHEAMKNMTVIGEYDYVQKDSVTANEGDDNIDQDSHGTGTLSLVGAYKEGQLVSPAYRAHFILAKTEDIRTEKHIEEDNWVAGIEWMEQMGVDVVSSSLGYNIFTNDPGHDYLYADMNGRTALTSIAATIAARKGVVVCNAMGNEGANANPPSLITPADADSIISVGAVSGSGALAGFSSNGPTSDGRTKPDVMSHGVATYWATTGKTGYSGSSQGTSLATPLVAGVAAMILSAHPELTPIQVRDALRTTASNAAAPNNSIGWGIINAYKAVLHDGMVISTDPEVTLTQDSNYSVDMYVVSNSVVKKDSIRLFYTTDGGTTFIPLPMTLGSIVDTATNSGKYNAVIPNSQVTPKFYVRGVDAANSPRTSPFNAPAELYDAKTGATGVPPEDIVPETFILNQNYPNPFNPSTTIAYSVPKTSFVTITVFDLLGRRAATLVNESKRQGSYVTLFDGGRLSSGTYFYRLQAGNFTETKRMMLVK